MTRYIPNKDASESSTGFRLPGACHAVAWIALAFLQASAVEAIEDTLIPSGAIWKFLDDGSDQGTAWRQTGFDDSTWNSGPARLGYGGNQATVVSFGPDPANKYATTYFRHVMTISNPSDYTNLTLRLLRDDGAIVYLNGTEIHRVNMPGGAIDYQSTAEFVVHYDAQFTFFYTDVDPSLLVAGDNTIAVELHRYITSNDLAFNLELIAGDAARIPNVIRGPYLQRAAPDEVVVRWRTDIATDSAVRFGPSPGSLDDWFFDSSASVEHEIIVPGMDPASRVFYSVGTLTTPLLGDDLDHYVDIPPIAGTQIPLRIWVTGDSGNANFRAEVVRDAYLAEGGAIETDLWIMLGDNAYVDGTDDGYQVAMFDMYPQILRNTPVWSTMGNHEAHTASSATQTGPYYDIFTLPKFGEAGGIPSGTEAYYSFDYANIHFICLDSHGSDRSVGGPMLTWLEADLADTQQEWIIAFWHHPPYSRGNHDSDISSQMTNMRENALPILEAGGVDLVLGGHSHSYERSMLIDGHYGFSSEFTVQMLIDAGDGDPLGTGVYEKPKTIAMPNVGAVYSVVGSSSSVQEGSFDHPIMVTSLPELGSAVIELDGDELSFWFLNDQGLTRDRFTIRKTSDVIGFPVPVLDSPIRGFLAFLVMALGYLMMIRVRRRVATN